MKTKLKWHAILLIAILTMMSCSKKDDDQITNTGTMTYQNKEYMLDKALITSQDEQNGITRYGITLYATDVKWTAGGTFTDGHTVSFDLFCSGNKGVIAGTYTLSNSDEYMNLKTGSSIFFEVLSTYPYTYYETLSADKVVVKVSGSVYDISFTGADLVDRPLTANYKGSLVKK